MTERAARVRALTIIVRREGARVVLDTNLFVAAFWNPQSASARILRACEEDRLRLVFSAAIRRELVLILRRVRTSAAYQARVNELLAASEEIHPTRSVRLVEDPDDDKFLECALDGSADYLVTSDDHLLRLGVVEKVRILSPGAFVREHLTACSASP